MRLCVVEDQVHALMSLRLENAQQLGRKRRLAEHPAASSVQLFEVWLQLLSHARRQSVSTDKYGALGLCSVCEPRYHTIRDSLVPCQLLTMSDRSRPSLKKFSLHSDQHSAAPVLRTCALVDPAAFQASASQSLHRRRPQVHSQARP